jgi:hypothetical protein
MQGILLLLMNQQTLDTLEYALFGKPGGGRLPMTPT